MVMMMMMMMMMMRIMMQNGARAQLEQRPTVSLLPRARVCVVPRFDGMQRGEGEHGVRAGGQVMHLGLSALLLDLQDTDENIGRSFYPCCVWTGCV